GVAGGSQVTIDHSSFTGNRVQGGASAGDFTGGSFGGAIEVQPSGLIPSAAAPAVTVTHSSFTGNQALQDAATNGADIGQGADGGATYMPGASLPVSHSTFVGNEAHAGAGSAGGAGADGGAGGIGQGGAIKVNVNVLGDGTLQLPTTVITHSLFVGNRAVGGD